MASTTLSVRVEPEVKKRLGKLAKSIRRSRSALAAEALSAYLDVRERQVAGIKKAMASFDRGEGVPYGEVEDWVDSWGRKHERPAPRRLAPAAEADPFASFSEWSSEADEKAYREF